MQQMLLWQVTGDVPKRLDKGALDLEKRLEDWIERDPGLLQSGLTIVGRQIPLEGGTLDLLALDPQGRWVVIEIKKGPVRRETVAQAVDYASCIARTPYQQLSEKLGSYLQGRGAALQELLEQRGAQEDADSEQRDVAMYAVGTGKDPGLDRMVEFLSRFEVPITVVSYDVFQTDGGQHILVRELAEAEAMPPSKPRTTVGQICQLAESQGIGDQFRKIFDAATRHGMFARPYTRSIMYTPPSNRTRVLLTVQALKSAAGLLSWYVYPPGFAEFYPVTEEQAESLLGPDGWRESTSAEVDGFIARLDQLFDIIAKHEAEPEE